MNRWCESHSHLWIDQGVGDRINHQQACTCEPGYRLGLGGSARCRAQAPKQALITLLALKAKKYSRDWDRLISSESSEENTTMTANAFYQQLGFFRTKEQVVELPPMSNKFPIIIASSSDMDKNALIKGDWYALQRQWLNQHPDSIIFQAQSGHFIQTDRPKLICEQLNKLINIAIQSSTS